MDGDMDNIGRYWNKVRKWILRTTGLAQRERPKWCRDSNKEKVLYNINFKRKFYDGNREPSWYDMGSERSNYLNEVRGKKVMNQKEIITFPVSNVPFVPERGLYIIRKGRIEIHNINENRTYTFVWRKRVFGKFSASNFNRPAEASCRYLLSWDDWKIGHFCKVNCAREYFESAALLCLLSVRKEMIILTKKED